MSSWSHRLGTPPSSLMPGGQLPPGLPAASLQLGAQTLCQGCALGRPRFSLLAPIGGASCKAAVPAATSPSPQPGMRLACSSGARSASLGWLWLPLIAVAAAAREETCSLRPASQAGPAELP